MASTADDRYRVDAVARAMELLTAMSRADGPVRLRDLTALLGWNKTTIFRLIRTLEEFGVVREVEGQGLVLGPALISLGEAAAGAVELRAIARPLLRALHDDVQETVNLCVMTRGDIVIVERVEGRGILGLRLGAGSTLPAYCTSVGHVLLAGLSDEEVRRRLAGCGFESRGPNTVSSLDELFGRLQQVRTQGFGINDEELATGHRAAAAPIVNHLHHVVAAINVSVPSAHRTRKELTNFLLPRLRSAAQQVSAELGAETDKINWGRTA